MQRAADRTLVRACLIAAVAWAMALPAATYVAGTVPPESPLAAASALVYGFGSVVCHQRPERSLWSWNVVWPVCARCAGLYVGGALVGIAVLVGPRSPSRRLKLWRHAQGAIAIAALPAVVSLLYEWSTGRVPGNALRLVTGLPIGFTVLAVIVSAADATEPSGREVD
jgi:uncharacterized membrane protein